MVIFMIGLLAVADRSVSLDDACAAHRASVEMIQSATMRVRLTLHDRPQTSLALPEPCGGGDYWRKGNLVRIRESYGASRYDWLQDASNSALVTRTKDSQGRVQNGASRRRRDKGTPNLDMWERALLSFNRQPLDSYLAANRSGVNVSSEELGAVSCVVIIVTDAKRKTKHSIWLDPSVNYLCRQSRTELSDGTFIETLVSDFREPAPGVFFPIRLEKRYVPARERGERPWHETAELSEVKINQPIPESTFHLDYPDGTILIDEIDGTYYGVTRDGRQSGAARPLGRDIVDSTGADPRTQTPADYGQRPISAVLVGSIAVCLSLALGAIAYRQRRKC